jgi:Amt family ammonium transporter
VLLATIGYWGIGYAFSYGSDRGFVGATKFFGSWWEPNDWRDFMFQWAFCSTTATIISGAVAERIRLSAYAICSIFVSVWVYPPVVHCASRLSVCAPPL